MELDHKGLGISIAHIGDQRLETIKIIIYYSGALVVEGPFQSVYHIHFCINQKELYLELGFKVSLSQMATY